MLKAVVAFAKKIPVPGQEFSSQSFHLSLEQELPATLRQEEVIAQLHETFAVVKKGVEAELANGNGERETRPGLGDPGSNEVPMPERRGPGTRGDDRISPAQQKFVTDLCRSLDPPIAIAELNARIRELYPPAESIYDIRRREASQLIDSLKEQKKRAA